LYRAGGGALKQERDHDPFLNPVEMIEAAVGKEEEEEDWLAVLKQSAAPGIWVASPPPSPSASGSSETTGAGDEYTYQPSSTVSSSSCLNTPIMEYDEGHFAVGFRRRRDMTALPATVTSSASASMETDHVVEMVVPVVTAEAAPFQFTHAKNDFDGIYDTWALSDSPEYAEEAHAPLIVVEGQTFTEKQAEDVTNEVKMESCYSDFMTVPTENKALGISDGFKTEEPTEDCEMGDDELHPSTVLFADWVNDDSIPAESDIPLAVQDGKMEEPKAILAPTSVDFPSPVVPSTINVADWGSILSVSVPVVQYILEPALVVPPSPAAAADEEIRPPPSKRGRPRGRPPVPLERPITPRVPRAARLAAAAATAEDSDHVYVTSDGGYLTEQEVALMKWRRGRDLNNVASKRCRENRKLRQQRMEEEAEQLLARNAELKRRLRALEAKVRRVKEYYLTQMLPGGGVVDPESLEKMWSS